MVRCNPCIYTNFVQAVTTFLLQICSCRERAFGHAEEAECITKSRLLDRTPGRCKALFIEGVFYEDRRVEDWEQGALGRPLVEWARRKKRQREEQQAERDEADKRELEQRWDRGGATAKRRRSLNEKWSGGSVAAAAAAGAGQTVISRLRADKAAEAREDDVRGITALAAVVSTLLILHSAWLKPNTTVWCTHCFTDGSSHVQRADDSAW